MTNTRELEIDAPWGKIALKLWGNEDDPAILSVHGVMDNAATFDRLIPLLPQHYFYICPDLPSHGKSSHFPPHLPIYSTNYILAYKLVMDYFKRKKYIIMGHSYGGQLGFLFAQMYPTKVEKLIMFDTLHLFPIPADYFVNFLVQRFEAHQEMEKKISKRKAPQYTYEEVLERTIKSRIYPLTEEAAKALLTRALIPKENGKYEISVDQRLKIFMNPSHDIRYVLQTIKHNPVTCPVLIVLGIESQAQRQVLKPLLNVYKKQKNFTIKYAQGHHDVHNNSPELVAPYVVKFLNNQKSKL